ncbi:hypothetical protein CPB84DRAFT_1772929 [Gymnopilus junonius]|uniref:Uncharacterized protein n=1 Tax=Gymnopilus junonius TaxID=109634 RepID=A0A9P5NUK4_GYMJU|nr:hypothetical protein CPB84DRAFT_1772929 [Gymnopilus junonius]
MDDVWQPVFLDPILDFLSEHLPPPLYSLVIRALSHLLAALTAISTLCITLLSNTRADWNVQALLPPIITVLAAYLALASIYRTTTWLARIIFWFLKWGTLFGILMAGAGYFMGSAGAGDAVGNQGPIPIIAGLIANLFEDKSRPQGSRKPRQTRTRTKRPKAWDSFDLHRDWQYQQDDESQDRNPEIQKLTDLVFRAIGQVFQRNWWNIVGKDSEVSESEGTQKSPTSKRRKAGRSHSR